MSAGKRLSDQQWQRMAPLLPQPNSMGRPRADDRRTLDAILFILRTGAPWVALPRELGSPATAWRRLRAWEADGTWEKLWRTFLRDLEAQEKLEWAQAFLDGSFVPAKKGALESD
jgi:transposase